MISSADARIPQALLDRVIAELELLRLRS